MINCRSQRSRHIASLGLILHGHVLESRLHVGLNDLSFSLYLSHLSLYFLHALLDDLWVQEAFHLRSLSIWWPSCRISTSEWILLHLDDFLKILNFATDFTWSTLRVLIQHFHFRELSIHRSHHVKKHLFIFIHNRLFKIRIWIGACTLILNDITYNRANLLLIIFKHFNLLIHHLSLLVNQALRYMVCILLLGEILFHFIDESAHFLVLCSRNFLHLAHGALIISRDCLICDASFFASELLVFSFLGVSRCNTILSRPVLRCWIQWSTAK